MIRLPLLTLLVLIAAGGFAGVAACALLRALALHVGGPDRRAA